MKCPHAPVEVSGRPRCNCGKTGHRSSECPTKRRQIKNIEDHKALTDKQPRVVQADVDIYLNGVF